MEYLIPSFLAGILTVLAPCAITLLPVILGGSLGEKNPWRPLIIAVSLGLSVIVFTLFLKATAIFIGIPQSFWTSISGLIIIIFGMTLFFPILWNKLAFNLKLYKSESLMVKNGKRKGLLGAILLGTSLGPVFSSCSPTYAVILAIVMPNSFALGLLNLVAYSLGLTLFLLAIGYGGQAVTKKVRFAVNPKGWFKRGLGVLLILTGLMIFTGFDKKAKAWILGQGYFGPINIEQSILDGAQNVDNIEI